MGTADSTTVGLLYPGFSAEDDYAALEARLGEAVRLPLVHTSVGEDAHRLDALLDLGGPGRLADGAKQLLQHSPDSVMWACTSGSFVFGWDGAREQVAGVAEILDVPVSSTSLAFAEAARALGLARVAVAASYPEDVALHFVAFLERAGVDVVSLGSHGIITAAEVGTFGRDRVLDIIRRGNAPAAQAVLVPDTAMHSLAWVEDMEDVIGKPVLTANQVTVWEGLRIAGAPTRFDGLGALFRV